MIQAFQPLKLPLIIAGTGPLENEFRLAAEKSPHIRFVGFQSGKALEELYQGAYACVLPSEWNENLSMVGIEALTYGKPVIGSRIGGIPELIRDGFNGRLFEPFSVDDLREKVVALRNLPLGDYERLCRNAQESTRHRFSLDYHYEELMKVYQKALRDPEEG